MPPNNSIFYIIKHHSTVHTKQCLYIIPYFRVFCKRVTHIFLKIFIAVEPGTFLHRLRGSHPPVALYRENEKGTAHAVPLPSVDMSAAQQQQLPQLPQPPQVLSPQVPQEPQPPLP